MIKGTTAVISTDFTFLKKNINPEINISTDKDHA